MEDSPNTPDDAPKFVEGEDSDTDKIIGILLRLIAHQSLTINKSIDALQEAQTEVKAILEKLVSPTNQENTDDTTNEKEVE